MLAALNDAILDGVDVINFSIGGTTESDPFDALEFGFLVAEDAGIFVSASAGNSGPGASTLDHPSPWLTTVAATTFRKAFNTVELGTGERFVGASTTGTLPIQTPLINGSAAGLSAEVNADGSGIDVRSRLSGVDFAIGENGGQTATRGTFVAGSPTFEEGEELVLFLDRQNDRGFRLAIGMAQGKYTVREEDGRKVASRNLAGLRFVDPKTNEVSEAGDEPEPGVALDALLTTIKGHLARERR